MAGNAYGVLSEEDVRSAQVLLDALAEYQETQDALTALSTPLRLDLRGIVAAHLADVRTAGYVEGVQRGRREAAHVVLDALRGEGLAP